jgi:hypothetical protein
MTLPSSGPISLNDIRNELTGQTNVQTALKEASIGTYATINTNSPSYPNANSPYAMSEWYGYNQNAVSLTSFSSSSTGDADTGIACTFTPDTTRYHNGISSYPQVGDLVYTNSAGTIPFDSMGNYYKNADGNAMVTDSFGEVTLLAGCR